MRTHLRCRLARRHMWRSCQRPCRDVTRTPLHVRKDLFCGIHRMAKMASAGATGVVAGVTGRFGLVGEDGNPSYEQPGGWGYVELRRDISANLLKKNLS